MFVLLTGMSLVLGLPQGDWTAAVVRAEAPVTSPDAAPEGTTVPQDSPAPVAIPPEISTAVSDLASEDFAVRQRAEKRLLDLGTPAFEPLLALLEKTSGEAGRRVLLILEQIWLQTPLPQADQLEHELDTLGFSLHLYQPDVKRMLQSHHRLREERASRALRRLNAIVQTAEDQQTQDLQAKFGQAAEQPVRRISTVIFPRSWTGTSADLWHLRRLSHLGILQIFVIRNNGITDSDMQSMLAGFTGMHLNERAEVFIGVEGQAIALDNRLGCQVTGVQPDGPAEYAGIQVGDLIQKVDGDKIFSFNDLVEKLKSKRGYQAIELTVERFAGEDPYLITVIGWPWEVRRFPQPPPPPLAEPLLGIPPARSVRPSLIPNR